MVKIDIDMPKSCADCTIRKIMGCRIANESGWLSSRRDERCLLKSDEPRVMTFEEVYKFSSKAFDSYGEDSPLYVECRERYPYQLKWLTVERAHEWMRDDEAMERRKLTYNNAKERWGWRCWSSRPSPELMASTPWKGVE